MSDTNMRVDPVSKVSCDPRQSTKREGKSPEGKRNGDDRFAKMLEVTTRAYSDALENLSK